MKSLGCCVRILVLRVIGKGHDERQGLVFSRQMWTVFKTTTNYLCACACIHSITQTFVSYKTRTAILNLSLSLSNGDSLCHSSWHMKAKHMCNRRTVFTSFVYSVELLVYSGTVDQMFAHFISIS